MGVNIIGTIRNTVIPTVTVQQVMEAIVYSIILGLLSPEILRDGCQATLERLNIPFM
jgi:hypothetical protein